MLYYAGDKADKPVTAATKIPRSSFSTVLNRETGSWIAGRTSARKGPSPGCPDKPSIIWGWPVRI